LLFFIIFLRSLFLADLEEIRLKGKRKISKKDIRVIYSG